MATENARVETDGKKLEIKWTTQHADHVLDNYIHRNKTHNLTFQQISNLARRVAFTRTKNRNFAGEGVYNGKKYPIFAIVTPTNLIIRTCYSYA